MAGLHGPGSRLPLRARRGGVVAHVRPQLAGGTAEIPV
jgi:hypothetical protein